MREPEKNPHVDALLGRSLDSVNFFWRVNKKVIDFLNEKRFRFLFTACIHFASWKRSFLYDFQCIPLQTNIRITNLQ